MRRPASSMLVALAALAIAAPSGALAADPTTAPADTSAAGSLPTTGVPFGTYTYVPLLGDATPYAGPATPTTLTGIRIPADFKADLSRPAVRKTLRTNGFVIVPGKYPLFHAAYEGSMYGAWPVFVTTDAAYDTWHLVFDKVLRTVEQEALLPRLEQLLTGWLANAQSQAAEFRGTSIGSGADRVYQLLQVAAAEAGVPVATLGSLAAQEKALIDAAAGPATSPILANITDYSLFTPRGHYTRNADLQRYFRAMSVLGQSAFCLPFSVQLTGKCPGTAQLRLGILAARALVRDPALVDLWKSIYEPTAFLVGMADDYTPFELADAVESVAPGGMDDPTPFMNGALVQRVGEALKAARPVQIDPLAASVRMMGTRFVLDSRILDQMIWPNVGTEDQKRYLPSPLDLAAAFGSDFAYGVQSDAGETAYAKYDQQMGAMQAAVAARPTAAWGSTVYDAWLAAIEPMWLPHGAAFPDFMRTPAWTAKAHQSGFGSYAELRHDTILYVKQAVGEMGGVPEPIAVRHWVEPDPVPFARLAAMADLARRGLDSRGLLSADMSSLLADFKGLASFLARVARGELAGRATATADNQRLDTIGGELSTYWFRSADAGTDGVSTNDRMAPVIADIASADPGVLEIGTGWIDRIYVLVPDAKGGFEVAAGGVYSYYEFINPPGVRWTDAEWRRTLASGQAPARPAWVAPAMK